MNCMISGTGFLFVLHLNSCRKLSRLLKLEQVGFSSWPPAVVLSQVQVLSSPQEYGFDGALLVMGK